MMPCPAHSSPLLVSLLAGTALVVASLAACAADRPDETDSALEAGSLTVLCEREEAIVGELLAEWSAATGIAVDVRYGLPGEAAPASDDGPPAGGLVFLSADAIGLGDLAASGRALPLPAEVSAGVAPHFVDAEGRWVGLTGRARVVVYDPQRVSVEELPADLAGFGDPAQRGRFGLAPRDRSLRVHFAAYRALRGGEALDRLLDRLAANDPVLHASDEALVAAVLDHEIDFALVDHPSLWVVRAEQGDARGAVRPLRAPDSSGYLDVAGVAVLVASPAATALVRHLLSPAVQARLAAATFEYPLLTAAVPAVDLVPLADLDLARIDYRAVAAALPATEEAIEGSALLP